MGTTFDVDTLPESESSNFYRNNQRTQKKSAIKNVNGNLLAFWSSIVSFSQVILLLQLVTPLWLIAYFLELLLK